MLGDSVASIGRMSFTRGAPAPSGAPAPGIPRRSLRDVTALVAGDAGKQPSGKNRARLRRRDVDCRCALVFTFHQQPLAAPGTHEGPRALELLAVKRENEATCAQGRLKTPGI